MMADGAIAVDAPVDRVRNPCEGVPVSLMKGCECPRDALHGQPVLHLMILLYVIVIIEVQEIVASRSAIGKDGNHRKNKAHGCNLPGLLGCGSRESCFTGRRFRRALARGFTLARFLLHDRRSPVNLNTAVCPCVRSAAVDFLAGASSLHFFACSTFLFFICV